MKKICSNRTATNKCTVIFKCLRKRCLDCIFITVLSVTLLYEPGAARGDFAGCVQTCTTIHTAGTIGCSIALAGCISTCVLNCVFQSNPILCAANCGPSCNIPHDQCQAIVDAAFDACLAQCLAE